MDSDVFKAKKKINEELNKFPSITTRKRFKATSIITRDDNKIILFFPIINDEKEEWIKVVLNGDI